jgi:hypothetical protein
MPQAGISEATTHHHSSTYPADNVTLSKKSYTAVVACTCINTAYSEKARQKNYTALKTVQISARESVVQAHINHTVKQ